MAPLRREAPVGKVNWCEVPITAEKTGQPLYHNAWATDHTLSQPILRPFVQAARSHRKHESEGHNVLKHQGYHFAYNFGHYRQYLALVLLLLNLLAPSSFTRPSISVMGFIKLYAPTSSPAGPFPTTSAPSRAISTLPTGGPCSLS